MVRIPFYTLRGGDRLECSSDNKTWKEVAYKNKNNASTEEAKDLLNYNIFSGTNNYKFRSYPIKIVVPTNMTFGFYIDQTDKGTQNYMYSFNDWNKKYEGSDNGIKSKYSSSNATDEYNYTFCATFKPSKKNTGIDYYLCFEDWPNGTRDLCDVVLAFSATPDSYTIVDDDEELSWILAAEDMGSIGDFDFNDLVVKVSNVTGKEEVTITPLAAGGTLPLYFYHKVDSSTGKDDGNLTGEFHSWFGDGTIPSSTMINTSSISESGIVKKITLDKNFSMTTNSYINSPDGTGTSKMGNFGIRVVKDGTETTDVTAPGEGEAPQMICVPATWQWPKEQVRITDAYPGDNGKNSFTDWAGEKDGNEDWYKYPQSDKVLH